MENPNEEYIKNRPQRLCHMCGKCCRVVTTPKTYEELCAARDAGDEGAVDFLSLFEPYPSIAEARKVSKETVDNIVNALKENGAYDESKLTFYKCRYIQDDNLCARYQDRLQLCDNFPATPWAVVPPGCGFEGWLFQQREEKKQKVRKLKENLLSLDVMLSECDDEDQKKRVLETADKLKYTISMYECYGGNDW